jgi:hypothetical protein
MTIILITNKIKELQFANNLVGSFKLQTVTLPSSDWLCWHVDSHVQS